MPDAEHRVIEKPVTQVSRGPSMTDILVILSLAGIAAGRFPLIRTNRATIALLGATLLILNGSVSFEEAASAVDIHTIILLFAMMVFNANLRMSGFFALAGLALKRHAANPGRLLALLMLFSSILSAFFINDTLVLMLTPVVLEVTLASAINPIPFLIALAVSANIGSMATIIGNPQNILIGTASGIGFGEFSSALKMPAIILLAAAWLLIRLIFFRDFQSVTLHTAATPGHVFVYKPLLIKSMISFLIMVLLVAIGLPVSLAGLGGITILLITRRIKPERVFADIDWSLLVLFPGLFVITRAASQSWLFSHFFTWGSVLMTGSPAALATVSAAMSQLISNVPTVMLLRQLIPEMNNPGMGWLVLAAATTLAGNLTLLGSVANLIVAEIAGSRGVRLGFFQYLKVGLPLTIIGITATTAWLIFIHR